VQPPQRTRVVTNSLNPRFDSAHYFDVLDASRNQLTIKLLDFDQLGSNRDIAYLQLPLASLAHSRRHCRWFELEHLSMHAKKAANMRGMARAQAKEAMKRKDRSALEAATSPNAEGASSPTATSAGTEEEDLVGGLEVRVARPRIQLELQLIYNDAGMLSTLVLPLPDAPVPPRAASARQGELIPAAVFHPPPAFDIDVLYSDLFRLLNLLQPLLSALSAIGPLLFWHTPWQSFLALCTWLFVCTHPWSALVLVELGLLFVLARAFVERSWADYAMAQAEYSRVRREHLAARALAQRKKDNLLFRQAHNIRNLLTGHEDDASASVNAAMAQSVLGRLNSLVNPFHTDSVTGARLDASQQAHMNKLVTHTLNGLLVSLGLKGSLAQYQAMLTQLADLTQQAVDAISWKHKDITKWIAVGVAALLLYSLLLPQRYLFLLAGAYVLTMFTPPSRAALHAVMGGVQFLALRQAKTKPPVYEGYVPHAQRATAAAAATNGHN